MGLTPYYAVHGVEPLLPFDITKATFLCPPIDSKLSDDELLASRARMLAKCNDDLANETPTVYMTTTSKWGTWYLSLTRKSNQTSVANASPVISVQW
ncbi:hypothetical protein AX17_005174 [Amanita inopinata Kibby_2008]|nr:hypothetical protein AX17_005174 [Amanita inopinata Kibby_2008]